MTHEEFKRALEADKISILIDKQVALHIAGSSSISEVRWQIEVMSWLAWLSIPGAVVVGYLYGWFYAPLMWFFLTNALFEATKMFAVSTVYSMVKENSKLYDAMKVEDVIRIEEKHSANVA